MLRLAVAVAEVESVTLTVNEDVPVDVGVPEICPVFAFNARPAGREPALTFQVYGDVPPIAIRTAVLEYATWITPCGKLVVVTCNGGLLTVMLRLAVALAGVGVCESVTLTVKLAVPSALGVPLIVPVEEFSVRPGGKAPAEMLH
jgi:hypothetical protein